MNKFYIDGVDVSQCEYYSGNAQYLSKEWTCRAEIIGTKCKEKPDCYFKQLARAKKEIEKLKTENFTFEELIKTQDNLIDDLESKLQAKEQECEELKETIDVFITDNNSLYSDDGKQPSNLDELQECMQSSMNEFLKYKQALDEIEKYCNDILADRYHYSAGAVLMATKKQKTSSTKQRSSNENL